MQPFRHIRLTLILMTLAAGIGPPCTASEPDPTVFQPSHVARIRTASSATVSPDGKWIAFNVLAPRQPLVDDDGTSRSELHVVDRTGDTRPYIVGDVSIGAPQWTPDSGAIMYIAKRDGDDAAAIYRIPIDGGESRRIIQHGSGIRGFALSADGRRIAFLATEEVDKRQKELEQKGFRQEIYEEDWRPTKVWITDIDSDESARVIDLRGSAFFVQWSPDGHQLVVVSAPTPLVDDSYMFKRIDIVDVVSGRVTEHVNNVGKLGDVAWSPDGRHLAFVSGADLHDPMEGRLMVTKVPGEGEIRDLMPDYQAHVASIAWKDSETIAWVADESTSTRVGSVTLEGRRTTWVHPGGPVLSGITLSETGSRAGLVGHDPHDSANVYSLTLEDGDLERLTNVNPWLAKMQFAKQEKVTWRASDGLELEGILIYPVNYVQGRKYPLIMSVHGGPESHEANGWLTTYSRPGQVAAARGFAVFYPNYRGSTGRGVEFSKMGQADAAGKEFSDLVDGVDHLVNIGLVDADRVGITGGSYGGYASAWGATFYSDRFAASVMFVGISDNVSKVGTTDIPEEMFLVHHRKRLWDDWDYFLDRSPIRHVQKNRTPTLILHGKQDPRVHPSQSLELFRHLKTLKQAPVRLVLYEGEGHGNRKAAARLDYNLRMLRWMEHYLQGPGGEAPKMELDYQSAVD